MKNINEKLYDNLSEAVAFEINFTHMIYTYDNVGWDEYETDGADIIVTAYGISARIARAAVKRAREMGIAVGLIRPKTLYPFPVKAFERDIKTVLCVEMSRGQMIEDVRLALNGRAKVEFYGRAGGILVDEDEILAEIRRCADENNI